MKIVQINATCGVGSTGKICVGISELLTREHIENYILYSSQISDYPLGIKCSDDKYIKLQALKSRICGNYGFNSNKATKRMIADLDRIKPDIVHLHNLHGHDCNLELLLTYLKNQNIKLIWTFHDCWTFTGYCVYFDIAKCDKWKTQCLDCLQKREYTWFFDRSARLFEKKKQLLRDIDFTIVTPSQWLSDMVKQSFLKNHPTVIINNGIDLSIFKPHEGNFRKRYGLEGKKIILGVSFSWGIRKGLDVFIKLSQRLPDDYKIILVGTNDSVDEQLPENILSIHRTQNQKELAEIYSAADVFVNPTREENYPTVNMESIACGTSVLTFKTGGSPEMLDQTCGSVVECDDVNALEKEIIRICTERPYSKEACVCHAETFDQSIRFEEYVDLYRQVYFK